MFRYTFNSHSIKTYHHHEQHNQFSHVFKRDEGILQGRHIRDITKARTKDSALFNSGAANEQTGTGSSSKKKKSKGKAKVQRRRRKDFKEPLPAGTGPQWSQSTKKARKAKQNYEMEALHVGSLAKNICRCLLSRRDQEKFPYRSDAYFQEFGRLRALASKVAMTVQLCVETLQRLQHVVYDMLMLAVDDIVNPRNLRLQSRKQRGLNDESEAEGEAEGETTEGYTRGDLPEKYPADFANKIIDDDTTIFALAMFVLKGCSTSISASQRIRNNEGSSRETRNMATRTSSDSGFYPEWIYSRYVKETGFQPFKERGIHIVEIAATRSALCPVRRAIEAHYKYAVVSADLPLLRMSLIQHAY